MDIKVKIEAPGLESAIHTLAQVLGNFEYPVDLQKGQPDVEPEKEKTTKPKQETKQKEEPKKEEKKTTSQYSLDTITAKTREFIQSNKENKNLLKGFLDEKGAPKVSELPEEHYDEYMAFLEEHSA